MSDFKWDEYPDATETKFNWDDFEDAPEKDDPGLLRTIIAHAAQGATFNTSDELGGAIAKARNPELVGAPGEKLPSQYELQRNNIRSELAAGEKNRQKTAIASNIGGSILRDGALGAMGVPVGSPIYQGISGAFSGAGGSESDSPLGVLKDAAIGGVTSFGATLGLNKLGKTVGPLLKKGVASIDDKVSGWLRKMAAEKALKATGASGSSIAKLGEQRAGQIGGKLLDGGAIGFGRTRENVLKAATEQMKLAGPDISSQLQKADDFGAQLGGPTFDWKPVMEKLQQEVGRLNPADKRAAASALRYVDDIAETAAQGGGFSAANELKSSIQNGIKWHDEAKITTSVGKSIQGILNDQIEAQMSKISPEAASAFKNAKVMYGAMKEATKLGKKGLQSEEGMLPQAINALGSGGLVLGPLLMGRPGAATLAAGGIAARNVVKNRGSSFGASLLNKASKSHVLRGIVEKTPNELGRFAGPLTSAMEAGDKAFDTTIYLLQEKHPEAREMFKKLMDSADSAGPHHP